MNPGDFLTQSDVAALFKVHPRSVLRWRRQGLLKPVFLGNGCTIRYRAEEVERFAKRNEAKK